MSISGQTGTNARHDYSSCISEDTRYASCNNVLHFAGDALCFEGRSKLHSTLHGNCSKESSSLAHTCAMALLSGDSEIFIQHILSHIVPTKLPESAPSPCTVKDPTVTILSFSGVVEPNKDICLYLCNFPTWFRIRSLVQMMSVECYSVFGRAHLCLHINESYKSAEWELESFSVNQIHDLKGGVGYIWFWIPKQFHRRFQWLLSHMFTLYSKSMMYRSSSISKDPHMENSNIREIYMVINDKDALFFLANLSSGTIWKEDLVSRYVTKLYNVPGDGFVNSCWKSSMCENLSTVLIKEENFTPQAHSVYLNDVSNEEQIEEMDIKDLKIEENFCDEETALKKQDKALQPKLLAASMQRGKVNRRTHNFRGCRCHPTQLFKIAKDYADLDSDEAFCVSPMPKFLGSVIIQCPACMIPKNRNTRSAFLELLNHVKRRHFNSCRSLFAEISKIYGPLIERMEETVCKRTKKRMSCVI